MPLNLLIDLGVCAVCSSDQCWILVSIQQHHVQHHAGGSRNTAIFEGEAPTVPIRADDDDDDDDDNDDNDFTYQPSILRDVTCDNLDNRVYIHDHDLSDLADTPTDDIMCLCLSFL